MRTAKRKRPQDGTTTEDSAEKKGGEAVRRFVLLFVGGAVWLLLAAVPVLADGGPHQLARNNGSISLAGDCAACHRAHTAQAAYLLKTTEANLCYSCHANGLGATTDVVNGVQYVPDASAGTGLPMTGNPVLGALRGGGFNYALIGTSSPVKWLNNAQTGRNTYAKVPVGASTATTSSHFGGNDIVWGNGVDSSTGTAGPTGITLECTSCHNPHGNGNYRILQSQPGSTTWTGFSIRTDISTGVNVPDTTAPGATFTTKNYTVIFNTTATVASGYGGGTVAVPAPVLASGVYGVYSNTTGDYWRKAIPWTGTTKDVYETGWDYTTGTTTLHADGTGLMTAWCITCHTRYDGQNTGGQPSSLVSPGNDSVFMFRHGTTKYGCTQCHVSHGSNAVIDAATSVNWPGQAISTTSGDSRLLKVDNRGTCQLCHDPTNTFNNTTYPAGSYPGGVVYPLGATKLGTP